MHRFQSHGQTLSTGFVVAIVGFFSSFPIVLQGIIAIGADAGQAASGLMFAALSMGLTGIGLSLWKRQPISVAWSTPGVAFLAVVQVPEAGFSGAVAGFLVAGLLTVIAGLWRTVGRLAEAIPGPIAHAMLAGVLLSLCIVPFRAIAEVPGHALPIVLSWVAVRTVNRHYAVPVAVIVAAALTAYSSGLDLPLPQGIWTAPVLTAPSFTAYTVFGIGVPLFIITMATQNIPGIAVLRSHGYAPPSGQLFTAVGGASILTALAGAPATCLAAITATMCAGEDAHPDPARRYMAAVWAGVFYCALGLFAGVITTFAGLAPPMVLGTLAGVALMGVFANSAAAALTDVKYRDAATITFLVTVSGVSVFGLSAAVWGLVLGLAFQAVNHSRPRG